MAIVEQYVLDRIEQFTAEIPKLAVYMRGLVATSVAEQLAEMPQEKVPAELRGWNPTPDDGFARVEISSRGNAAEMRNKELRMGRGAMAFGYEEATDTALIHPHSLADRVRYVYDCAGVEETELPKLTDMAIADYVIRGMLKSGIPVDVVRIQRENEKYIENLFTDIRANKL